MAYNKTVWKDLPDMTTPVNASNLNNIEDQVEANTNAVETNTNAIGTLSNLNTTNKSNLVVAINEVNNKNNYPVLETKIGTIQINPTTYKDVYRKVIPVTSMIPSGDSNIPHGISNLESVISYYFFEEGGDYMFPYIDAQGKITALVQVTSSNAIIRNQASAWYNTNHQFYLILEYTKSS